MIKNALLLIIIFAVFIAGCTQQSAVSSFDECVEEGNPVMESYPRQCRSGGTTFVEKHCTSPDGSLMTVEVAFSNAQNACSDEGMVIKEDYVCNENSGTVWFELELNDPLKGCSPACVINIQNGSAEINYRCTGLISETNETSRFDGVVSLASDLEIPWSIGFLPDNRAVFTERTSRINIINSEGLLLNQIIISDVYHIGEGGLLGVAVHPDFSSNSFVYIYYTYSKSAGVFNKIVRYELVNNSLNNEFVVIEGLPGGVVHNGGRIKFGPDNKLYAGVGDSGNAGLAQDLSSLAGKILRINYDGSVPDDNPFNDSLVYSYGHRNPQGLAWDDQGRLWATEHGHVGTDELNLIMPGRNYGWPVIIGDNTGEGMESPVIHSGADTWAPSGMTYYDDSLFFAGLRGQALYEYDVINGSLTSHFKGTYGRLRAAVLGSDDHFYLLTSNRDGRGSPSSSDDQIIKIRVSEIQ